MNNIRFQILEISSVQKDNKIYNIVKIYMSCSEVIISCFVDKNTLENIKNNKINNENLSEHLNIKVDKDMKLHVFIK